MLPRAIASFILAVAALPVLIIGKLPAWDLKLAIMDNVGFFASWLVGNIELIAGPTLFLYFLLTAMRYQRSRLRIDIVYTRSMAISLIGIVLGLVALLRPLFYLALLNDLQPPAKDLLDVLKFLQTINAAGEPVFYKIALGVFSVVVAFFVLDLRIGNLFRQLRRENGESFYGIVIFMAALTVLILPLSVLGFLASLVADPKTKISALEILLNVFFALAFVLSILILNRNRLAPLFQLIVICCTVGLIVVFVVGASSREPAPITVWVFWGVQVIWQIMVGIELVKRAGRPSLT